MNAKKCKTQKASRYSSPSLAPLAASASGALLATLLMSPSGAQALGFRVPNQDAEAIARGNAFTATADNPSAIYYNPAGITQLEGQNLQLGVHALSINSTYTDPNGKESHSKFSIQPVPELYYTYQLKDLPITLGAGLYATYGLAMEWPEGSPFRTEGTPYRGSMSYITFNPVAAWKITDQLSIAAGPTINYSQVLLRQGFPAGSGLNQFKFRGEDTAFGGTAGILWKPLDQLSLGANYHSATTMKYGGSASTDPSYFPSTSSTAELPFAQFVMFGVSYRPTPNWNFEVDADWTDWSKLKTVTFQNTPLPPTGHTDAPFPLNWKSSWLFEVGATRYLPNGYLVSAGYFYSQNSTSDADFSPIVPDTNLHVGSVGFGHKGDHWGWMLAAQIITGPARVISNDNNPAVNGSYQWLNGSLDFSVRYHF